MPFYGQAFVGKCLLTNAYSVAAFTAVLRFGAYIGPLPYHENLFAKLSV